MTFQTLTELGSEFEEGTQVKAVVDLVDPLNSTMRVAIGEILTVENYDPSDNTYWVKNDNFYGWVTRQAIELENEPVVEAYFVKLTNAVVLTRRGGVGEPKRVTLRLEAGTFVPVVRIAQSLLDEFPFACVWAGWRGVFMIGKGNQLVKQLVKKSTIEAYSRGELEIVPATQRTEVSEGSHG